MFLRASFVIEEIITYLKLFLRHSIKKVSET